MTALQVAASCISALGLISSGGPVQQPLFTSSTDVVPLYVTVIAGDGRFAPNLTARDFTVLEDGHVRPISQFEHGGQTVAMSVLVDESPSVSDARTRTQAAASEVVRGLRSGDIATIGAFSQSVTLGSDLTGDATELMQRVRGLAPGAAGTALWDALDAGISAVDQASGRRVVLVLTDGEDNSSFRNQAYVRDRVIRSGVMLYVIGVAGSDGRPNRGLLDMARDTGGSFVVLRPKDNVERAIRQTMDELHHQYLLGFAPAQVDGRVHTLAVRVSGRGLTVRSRTSYVAERRNDQPPVSDQLRLDIAALAAEPPDYQRQRLAADNVARLGPAGSAAIPALIKVIGQPVVVVGGDVMTPVRGFEEAIAAARKALRAIGAPAVPALIDALSRSGPAGGHAAAILADLKDSRAVAPLAAALGGSHDFAAQTALVALALPATADAVAARLTDPSATVRQSAMLVLIELHDIRALPPITDALATGAPHQRWESVGHLADLRPPDIRARLQVLLTDADAWVRSEAASRLGDVGDGRDVPQLIAALSDLHERVRWGAARALGLLRDARALAPLRAALKTETSEGNRQTMAASIAAISKQ